MKEMKWLFDCGIAPKKKFKATKVFVTHTHLDHVNSLVPMLTTKAQIEVYAPRDSVPFLENFLDVSHKLNTTSESKSKCNLKFVGVEGGEVMISGSRQLRVFKCDHTVQSVAYGFEMLKSSLKEEYSKLSQKEISELSKKKVQVSEKKFIKEFCFVGDTSAETDWKEIVAYPFVVIG